MIYMYNETQTAWLMSEISAKLNRFVVEKKAKDGRVRKLSVLTTKDIQIENLDELVNMNSVITVYDGTSGVYYQKKDQSPVISSNSKFDKDVFFISLNLEGSIIKDITTKGVQIVNYLITKNQLDIVLSTSSNNRDNDIEIVLYNKNTNVEKIYTFAYNMNGYYEVRTDIVENEETEQEVQNFKLTKFRPAVITHCVIADASDMTALNELIRRPDIFYINTFSNKEELEALIARLKEERYHAVTLFMDIDDAKYITGDTYNTIKNAFMHVNVLLNTDKVIRR